MKKCKNIAIYEYEWAGETKRCCGKHADQIRVVGNVIGNSVVFRPIVTKDECPNVDEEQL